jgi:hypothetical protein
MLMEDLERIFFARYEEGALDRTKFGVKVRFRDGGRVYTYNGLVDEIAARMKLDRPEKDLNGELVLPSPEADGCYSCEVQTRQTRFNAMICVVRSPFTGTSIEIYEAWQDDLPAGLWGDMVRAYREAMQASGRRKAFGKVPMSLETMRRLKQVYETRMTALKGGKDDT